MRARLLDYNTGRHYDVSDFFDDRVLEEAYAIRSNRDVLEAVFADAYNSTKIVFEDPEALGFDGEYYLIGHVAKVRIRDRVVEVSEIAAEAVENIGGEKIYTHAVEVLELPDGVAARVADVVTRYAKLMRKPAAEIKREILKRL